MFKMNPGYAQPPFFLESYLGAESDSLSLEQFGSMDQLEQAGLYHTGSFDLSTLDPSLVPASASVAQHHSQHTHPIARFIGEPQRSLFTMPKLYTNQSLQGMPRTSAPVNTLPYASQNRIASPSPSQGLTSCSSGLSPPADSDYSQDLTYYSPSARPREDFSSFGSSSQFNLNQNSGSWSGQTLQSYAPQQFGQNANCVNLSQVQGVPDAEEMSFEAHDNYGIGVHEYNMAMNDGHTIHVTSSRQNSYYDEGLGSSIHDIPTPKSIAASYRGQEVMDEEDLDADGDAEQEIVVVDPGDDTDYTPSNKTPRRNKSRRSGKSFNPLAANTKNARVVKQTSKAKGTYECKACDAGPFKDSSALAKHTATAHTRAFACVFKFAGCDSTFGSKNEWKRHVQSQHLNLNAWLCTQGSCGKAHGPKGNLSVGSEFNRKDLFTQHVRRMHVPPGAKKKQKTVNGKEIPDPDFEAHLKKLQVSCSVIKRQGPEKLRCPVYSCDHVFQGQNPLDERMEHVGKHVEKSKGTKVDVRSERDELLVMWALREGVIERKPNGGYRLGVSGTSTSSTALGHGHGHVHVHDDEDAEGEADD